MPAVLSGAPCVHAYEWVLARAGGHKLTSQGSLYYKCGDNKVDDHGSRGKLGAQSAVGDRTSRQPLVQ